MKIKTIVATFLIIASVGIITHVYRDTDGNKTKSQNIATKVDSAAAPSAAAPSAAAPSAAAPSAAAPSAAAPANTNALKIPEIINEKMIFYTKTGLFNLNDIDSIKAETFKIGCSKLLESINDNYLTDGVKYNFFNSIKKLDSDLYYPIMDSFEYNYDIDRKKYDEFLKQLNERNWTYSQDGGEYRKYLNDYMSLVHKKIDVYVKHMRSPGVCRNPRVAGGYLHDTFEDNLKKIIESYQETVKNEISKLETSYDAFLKEYTQKLDENKSKKDKIIKDYYEESFKSLNESQKTHNANVDAIQDTYKSQVADVNNYIKMRKEVINALNLTHDDNVKVIRENSKKEFDIKTQKIKSEYNNKIQELKVLADKILNDIINANTEYDKKEKDLRSVENKYSQSVENLNSEYDLKIKEIDKEKILISETYSNKKVELERILSEKIMVVNALKEEERQILNLIEQGKNNQEHQSTLSDIKIKLYTLIFGADGLESINGKIAVINQKFNENKKQMDTLLKEKEDSISAINSAKLKVIVEMRNLKNDRDRLISLLNSNLVENKAKVDNLNREMENELSICDKEFNSIGTKIQNMISERDRQISLINNEIIKYNSMFQTLKDEKDEKIKSSQIVHSKNVDRVEQLKKQMEMDVETIDRNNRNIRTLMTDKKTEFEENVKKVRNSSNKITEYRKFIDEYRNFYDGNIISNSKFKDMEDKYRKLLDDYDSLKEKTSSIISKLPYKEQ
jgi:hypothetical protein